MIVDLVAIVRCDFCSEQLTTKAHFERQGGFRLEAAEGWMIFQSGLVICPTCQVNPTVHVMQAGVTLCGISDVPAEWPKTWKWVSVAQTDLHGQVNCPGCLKEVA